MRNHFEVLQEEEDLAQDPRKTIVEEVVACTPEVLLKSATVRQESTMSSPSSIGKSGSMGLRAMKDWLCNGRCQESSPTTSEFQKLQELRRVWRQMSEFRDNLLGPNDRKGTRLARGASLASKLSRDGLTCVMRKP